MGKDIARWLALGATMIGAGCSAGDAEHPPLLLHEWSVSGTDHGTSIHLPAAVADLPDGTSYELQATAALPPEWRDRAVSLSIPFFPALTTALADGEPATRINPDPHESYRAAGPQIWLIPRDVTADGRVELRLQIEHRWPHSGVIRTVPRLSASTSGDATTTHVATFNNWVSGIGLGALVAIGISNLLLFAASRNRAYGVLCVQTILATYYLLFVLGMSQSLFGARDVAVLGLTLNVAAILGPYYSMLAFGSAGPPRWWPLLALPALVPPLIASDPFSMARYYAPITVGLLGLVFTYQVWYFLRLRRQRPGDGEVTANLWAWLSIAVCAVSDAMFWIQQGEPLGGRRLAGIGLTMFALLQFAAHARAHLLSLKRADRLNAELAAGLDVARARQHEIELLNVELRRQIADRSRFLADALARMASGPIVSADLQPGDGIDDRYEIVRPIGTGAMGTVYEVRRQRDGRHLALKVMTKVADARQLARFAREAQIASNIHHRNVVDIVDVDFASAGYMYLVMELVPGDSLREHAGRFGDLDWALEVLAQIGDGLAAIHAQHIVHRDLKQANVLLTSEDGRPCAKISDFGISGFGAGDAAETAAMLVRGAPGDATGPAALLVRETPGVSMRPAGHVFRSDDANTSPDEPTCQLDSSELKAGDEPSEPTAATLIGRIRSARARDAIELDAEATAAAVPAALGKGGSTMRDPTPIGSPRLTHTGLVLGTPAYMAPEIALDATEVQPSADIFSFGVLAFELLTGTRPFASAPGFAALYGQPLPTAERFDVHCPQLAPQLSMLLQRCLSFDPAERPDAAELTGALRAGARAGAGQATAIQHTGE